MTPEKAFAIALYVLEKNPLLVEKWLNPKLRFESGTSGWLK